MQYASKNSTYFVYEAGKPNFFTQKYLQKDRQAIGIYVYNLGPLTFQQKFLSIEPDIISNLYIPYLMKIHKKTPWGQFLYLIFSSTRKILYFRGQGTFWNKKKNCT